LSGIGLKQEGGFIIVEVILTMLLVLLAHAEGSHFFSGGRPMTAQ
jgi:hypothetical protein